MFFVCLFVCLFSYAILDKLLKVFVPLNREAAVLSESQPSNPSRDSPTNDLDSCKEFILFYRLKLPGP